MQKNAITHNIKNIIFDFGGVILNIDYQLTVDAFKEIGMHNFNESYSQAAQIHLFDDLETGKISPLEFRNGIRSSSGINFNNEEIDYAWNKIILDLPKKRLDLLLKLKEKYNIFLLSNTNSIHYDLYIKDIQKYGFTNFNEIFKKAYFSFEVGLRKPDSQIFEYVIKDQKLNLEETLFIDDSIQHIETANNLGINVYHLKDNKDITDLFDDNYDLIVNA